MFRVSTWVLLGVIAASLFAWVLRGPTLEGPKVAGWTDLGTWGWSGGNATAAKPPVTAKVVTEKVATPAPAPAAKPEKRAKTEDAPKAKDEAWVTEDKPVKVAEAPKQDAPKADAPKAKEAAPWNLDNAKGVDIDLNIKMPWQKDKPAPAAKPAAAPAPAPAADVSTGVPHGSPWPIATEVPNWGAVMKVPAPATSDDAAWEVEAPKKAAAPTPAPIQTAMPWPIATEVRNWAAEMQVPEWKVEEPAPVQTAIPWPIADAPVKWTNFRIVAAEPEPNVTAKAIDWPIADAPVKWTNVRMAAPVPEPNVTEAHPFPWPIAEAPVQWTNFRMPEPETEVVTWEKPAQWEPPVTWEKPAQWQPPVVTEEARRAELTPEQVACEDELRRIYKSGVIRFKSASAVLDKSSTETLNALAAAAKGCAKAKIRVEGHTDSQGANAYNQSLSERRAQAIAAYLAGAGVDKGSVTAQGFGEERPIATNDNAAGMAQNRRIEFTVY